MTVQTTPRRSRRRSRAVAAGLLVIGAVAGGLLTAAPANAAVSNCPAGSACFWKDAGYKTGGSAAKNVRFTLLIADFRYWNYGPSKVTGLLNGNANDSASSVYNNGKQDTTHWYQGSYSSGYMFKLKPGNGDDNLSNATGAVPTSRSNDNLSSGFFSSCDPAYRCS
ncbi:peptidase inhibitor family I36 protein [Gryllotalpicola reticulitermitis]|uniref:Peptidase inhibitor family I36 protein n=1 Tax=Gryllotalpicola reticulitermitis TaxID=1184153 RepID=A0ABV8Q8D2_9MICO